MGARVRLASVLLLGLAAVIDGIPVEQVRIPRKSNPLPSAGLAYVTKGMATSRHSAALPSTPSATKKLLTSATNYQAFPAGNLHYNTGYGASPSRLDYSLDGYSPSYNPGHEAVSGEVDASSGEEINTNQFLGTLDGFSQYKASNSFNFEGPSQLESINTKSYHKESEPFDVAGYSEDHHHEDHHKHEEEHAEVHYHQHKHVHKHDHKQDHKHHHNQDHKHHHGHKHDHHQHHDHKHVEEHKHDQHHKHEEKHEHGHKHGHHHGHKHDHHQEHKHDHHHKNEHKHDHHHGHEHKHHQEHKHDHHHGHKHDHHHGHKHDHHQHHKHEHHQHHKHGHKHEHGHKHHEEHKHGHHHHHHGHKG